MQDEEAKTPTEKIEDVAATQAEDIEAFERAELLELSKVSEADSKASEDGSYKVVDGYEVATKVTDKSSTDQVNKTSNNPTGKGGFGDNPQNRNPGGWKKEDTARYKLEQIMKFNDLQHEELQSDPETPTFEKRLSIAVQNGNWKEIEGMINQIYGKPQESVDITTKGDSVSVPTVRIIDERQPDKKEEKSPE